MLDYKMIVRDLLTLNEAASDVGGRQKEQNLRLIDVGEYGFALDSIAYAYLDNDKHMPADLFEIFEKLALVSVRRHLEHLKAFVV